MASKSYGWYVRNIAKISPKMAKIGSFFYFFFDFLKNCSYDSNEFFYSHSTSYYGPLSAISLNSYGWDVRNIAKVSPKMAKKTVIFQFSQKLSRRFKQNSVILYTIVWSYWSESEGKRPKPTPLPHMRLLLHRLSGFSLPSQTFYLFSFRP